MMNIEMFLLTMSKNSEEGQPATSPQPFSELINK